MDIRILDVLLKDLPSDLKEEMYRIGKTSFKTTEDIVQSIVFAKIYKNTFYEKSMEKIINKFYSNVANGNYNSLNQKESHLMRTFHFECYEYVEQFIKFPNDVLKSYYTLVTGDHGSYYEFELEDLNCEIGVYENEKHRLKNPSAKYDWYIPIIERIPENKIKIYLQKNTVKYADYKIGKYYVSPYDILDFQCVEISLKDRKKLYEIKQLRQKTGLGIGECKKALVECDGDQDKAVEYLKRYGARVCRR